MSDRPYFIPNLGHAQCKFAIVFQIFRITKLTIRSEIENFTNIFNIWSRVDQRWAVTIVSMVEIQDSFILPRSLVTIFAWSNSCNNL